MASRHLVERVLKLLIHPHHALSRAFIVEDCSGGTYVFCSRHNRKYFLQLDVVDRESTVTVARNKKLGSSFMGHPPLRAVAETMKIRSNLNAPAHTQKPQARNKSKALAMLTGGKEPKEGSGLEVVVGDIRDKSSLVPSLFKVTCSRCRCQCSRLLCVLYVRL